VSNKSELRDHVRRIVGEDPTISTINLQKRIAQELDLPKLPSRSHVDTLRAEALFGLRREQAKAAEPDAWNTDTLLHVLWRNFERFTPSDFAIAEELVQLIESLASADAHAHADKIEYNAHREALPDAQAQLDALRAIHADPEAAALRAKVEQVTSRGCASVWPRSLTLSDLPLGRLSDWSPLAGLVALLRERGAIDAK
jgi:hypothetical protein